MPNNQQKTPRARNGNVLLFARNFFRHPRMLGSIVPSSRFLIKQLLEPINWGRARVIVEYGPGVGGITAELLRHMRSDATLIAIEMNPDFVAYLRDSLPRFVCPKPTASSFQTWCREVRLKRRALPWPTCLCPLAGSRPIQRNAIFRACPLRRRKASASWMNSPG